MSQKRIYVVGNGTDKRWLINAVSPAQAVRHVVKAQYTVAPATTYEVADLVVKGVELEEAKE
jgi:ribosome biogenesis SPOUT family RNA methylase Rps3